MSGHPQLEGARAVVAAHVAGPEPTDPLAEALRRWRDGRAKAARTSPDVVLPDDSLEKILSQRPDSADGLVGCGLGPARANRYGPELLELIRSSRRP